MWSYCEINEVIKIKELFSLFLQKYPKEYDFKGEQHNFWECLYVRNGQVCVSADERIYRLKENEMIFHKPMEFHKFYIESKEGAQIFVMSFSMEGELSDYFKNKVFTLSYDQKRIIEDLIKYVSIKEQSVFVPEDADVYNKYRYPFMQIKTFPQMITAYIYQLFLSLVDDGEVLKMYKNDDSDIFKKAVKYMTANISLSLSIENIAKYCNVSVATLKRIFARYTGVGVHKYFLGLKMKRAKEMLESGETVSRTAEKLGFSSQGYFSLVFKRETGKLASGVFISKEN